MADSDSTIVKKPDPYKRVRAWHAEFGDQIHAFLAKAVRSPEHAQDLSQEVFHRMLRIERPELIRCPRAYLYRVAIHVLDEWRNRADKISIEVSVDLEQTYTPEKLHAESERNHTVAEIRTALKSLPPSYSAALILHWHYGMTYSEIASHLDATERMVKRYIVKGYAALRIWFDDNGNSDHG